MIADKRGGSGFCGFYGVSGDGAAHKDIEAPRNFEYMVFTKDGNPVNLLNPLNLWEFT